MATINKHGHKMVGLKTVSGETKWLGGYYSGEYLELFYALSTGRAWTKYQYSLGQNSWTEYNDSSIVRIGNISEPATMQEIADIINMRLADLCSQAAAM